MVDEPAVIVAADAFLLDETVGEVGAAVRAVAVEQAVVAREILEQHKVFAEQAHGLDRIGVEFARAGNRHPVAAQQIAHWCAGTDAAQQFVLGGFHDPDLNTWVRSKLANAAH
jgi:hypothetical protein